MQQAFAISALALSLNIWAGAQSTGERQRNGKVERELMQLEREWSAAYLRHDLAAIERIVADDYVGIDGRGIMTNKAQELAEAKPAKPGDPAPPFLVLEETVTDMRVRKYGNTAVVTGRTIEKIRSEEKDGEIQYRRTTVWVRRQGRWQCVSFHGSRILRPPASSATN